MWIRTGTRIWRKIYSIKNCNKTQQRNIDSGYYFRSIGGHLQRQNLELLIQQKGQLKTLSSSSICLGSKSIGRKKMVSSGNTKGGSITVPLTSCLNDLESAV